MIIREAVAGDIPKIIRLGEQLHEESANVFPPLDHERMRDNLAAMIDHDLLCVFVAEHEGRLIGGINGTLSIYFFADAVIASHDIFYVDPTARGGVAARRLIAAFEQWANDFGAYECRLSVHTGINRERTESFYERLGYHRVGGLYRKVL